MLVLDAALESPNNHRLSKAATLWTRGMTS